MANIIRRWVYKFMGKEQPPDINGNAPQVLDEQGIPFEKKVEILLWGDKELGIEGLRDISKRHGRFILWALILAGINTLLIVNHYGQAPGESVILSLLQSITALVIGG